MNAKKANWAFLITIVGYVGVSYVLALFFPEVSESLFLGNLICELTIALPILIFALVSKEKLFGFLGFHKVKISTILMTVLFTFLTMPTVTLFNLISQLWAENAVISMMDSYQMNQMPFWQMFLPIGIMAPLFEEVTCRGGYYCSYRKSGSRLMAMMFSTIIFALMHMNLNQTSYAFVMGILVIMLVEVSGSIWTSILYHALVNGSQVILMYAMMRVSSSAVSDQSAMITKDYLLFAIAIYLILTVVTLPIAWAALVWIGNNEGKAGALSSLWSFEKKKKDKMLTLPLVIAFILCILAMTGILYEWINMLIIWLMTL